jgi:hypothetical protein
MHGVKGGDRGSPVLFLRWVLGYGESNSDTEKTILYPKIPVKESDCHYNSVEMFFLPADGTVNGELNLWQNDRKN